VASLRFLQYGERLQQLQQLLGDENPRIRSQAVEEVSLLPSATATQLLLPLLENETDSRCLTAVARNLLQISPHAAAQHIRRVLAETEDQRLRADIIETIGKVRAADIGEDFVTPFLDSPHHRVRASAVISTIRLTRQSDMLSRALRKLAEMAHDAGDLMRASAAAVMGELGLPLFVPALLELAASKETVVAGNAASALARIQTPDAVVGLENLLFHDNHEVAERAESLLAASTRDSISRISRLLPGITAEERRRLTTRLRSGRHQDSQEVLANILCIENLEQRRNLIALLEKSDREMVRLMQACIKMGDEDRVELSIEPLLLLAGEYVGSAMPDWAALLGILAGGTLEEPEEHESLHESVCGLLKMLWHERLVIAQTGVAGAAMQKWQGRVMTLVRLVACFSSEPAPMSRSINELKSGKAYARGMAAEYIEARAGHALAQLIVPLADASTSVPQEFEALVKFAAGKGVATAEDSLAAARNRLQRFALIEEKNQ
jgi:HEAT repeat protein